MLVLTAERRREVALAGVVHHRHDRWQVRAAARQLQRGRDVTARRDAAEDPVLRRQAPRHRQALGGRGGDDAGQERHVEVVGDESVADALDAVRPPFPARQERALLGLHGVEAYARIALAQVASDARERPAAALGGDERADDTAALLPDLRAGGAIVGLDVVGVVELAGHPVAGRVAGADLLEAAQREIDVALAARREDQVGAVRARDLLALVAHSLGHDDRAPVALDGRDEGAGDPGVSGGALEHAHARAQVAPRLRALEHVQVDAVLEAAGGAVPLELGVDGRRDAGGHAAERDERGAPDGLSDRAERAAVRVPENRHGSVIVPEIRGGRIRPAAGGGSRAGATPRRSRRRRRERGGSRTVPRRGA